MKRYLTRHLAATVTLTAALAGTAWANGEDFFAPASSDKPIQLAYTGQVRDSRTRRPIQGDIYVVIVDRATGTSFPFTNDSPGHYRGPDVGAVEALTGAVADPSQLEIQVSAQGYKTMTIDKLPRKKSGLVSVDFRLERDPTYSGWASAQAQEDAKSGGPWSTIAIVGVLAVILGGVVARRLVPRQSSAR